MLSKRFPFSATFSLAKAAVQIYGVYRVGYTSKQQNQQLKMDILVMEYLFYKKNVKQVWDLKGSLRNR